MTSGARAFSTAIAGCALAWSALAGCGPRHVPSKELASSEAAIRAARLDGAAEYDEAALHLRIAEDEVRTARTFLKDGETDDAAWMLRRAKVDAELARGLVHESKAKEAADEARSKLPPRIPHVGVSPVRPLPEP